MKLDSKLFDRIRVKPDMERAAREIHAGCEWQGCSASGGFRAPKGRGREGQYFNFCIDHVREYNKSYNYFAGLPDDAIADYQKDAATGHRPTWKMGVNRAGGEGPDPNGQRSGRARPGRHDGADIEDPFGLFRSGVRGAGGETVSPGRRRLTPLQQKAFDTLGLDENADKAEIKARYKLLVKRHHPDANGGDRSLEDRLRQIIQAYNYLKTAGFC
ncbi:Chaperone protein DnaJ [Hartmannibacter diazotrophicus]|uniref:Chaperone protein DnaJ n=1 Tax=Hartmannibacter diazotrophicus TaxID=1482074 RepID=A0A2C9DE18_9HYPH|nr:J domain-containing protein [Hartmannibacter diazotrophicus]SON57875.1 Chaperone protein DnaJ [Hartmannibacter diazotrophicus]